MLVDIFFDSKKETFELAQNSLLLKFALLTNQLLTLALYIPLKFSISFLYWNVML